MPNKDIPDVSPDPAAPGNLPAEHQAILEELQAKIALVTQMPGTVAGKSIEKVCASLDRFYEVLGQYYRQMQADKFTKKARARLNRSYEVSCQDYDLSRQQGCSDDATIIGLIVPHGTLVEFGIFGSLESPDWMRYVPNPHVEGDVYILVKNVSAVRLASEVRTPVSARLFDYEVYNPESAITACATYVLEPGYVYLYEGGVSLRAVQLSWFIHNCTIYSQRTYRPTDSDLQANDKDWNDARSLLAKFTIDAITIDALIKNAPKELIEIVNWGSLLELMAAEAIDVSVLEEVLKNTLKVSDLASRSHYATQMVNQFIDGSGDAPPYEPFSDLSQAVASNSVFDVTVESALKDLDSKVAALNLASGGKLDCNALQLPNRPLPFFPKSDLPIGWPVGGTQGLEIKVQRLWADPYHNMYSATIDFTIFDVFGVGDDDVYAPPLIAFWLLQHIKEFEGRHKPFINEIIVRIDINNRQFWTMYEKG